MAGNFATLFSSALLPLDGQWIFVWGGKDVSATRLFPQVRAVWHDEKSKCKRKDKPLLCSDCVCTLWLFSGSQYGADGFSFLLGGNQKNVCVSISPQPPAICSYQKHAEQSSTRVYKKRNKTRKEIKTDTLSGLKNKTKQNSRGYNVMKHENKRKIYPLEPGKTNHLLCFVTLHTNHFFCTCPKRNIETIIKTGLFLGFRIQSRLLHDRVVIMSYLSGAGTISIYLIFFWTQEKLTFNALIKTGQRLLYKRERERGAIKLDGSVFLNVSNRTSRVGGKI